MAKHPIAGETITFDARTGIVWSPGPVANSAWVAEDGDPSRMVVVKFATTKLPHRAIEVDATPAAHFAHVREHGVLVEARTDTANRAWSGEVVREFHSTDCPAATVAGLYRDTYLYAGRKHVRQIVTTTVLATAAPGAPLNIPVGQTGGPTVHACYAVVETEAAEAA